MSIEFASPTRKIGSALALAVALLCLSCSASGRGSRPSHFNQSCGAACSAPTASSTGELLTPTALRTGRLIENIDHLVETVHGFLAVTKFLDEAQREQAERILTECAREADFKVNEQLFGEGKSLPEADCGKVADIKNKTTDTWRQYLGKLKHAAAFLCVQNRMAATFPENFAIEPRYRRDELTKELLLTDRWIDSQRPDLVLHFTRNATRIQCIYDFKFPCDLDARRNPLADPRSRLQLRKYNALGNRDCPAAIVTPGLGIDRPASP